MKVWVVYAQRTDEDGSSDNVVTLFSNQASAERHMSRLIESEAEWWRTHESVDFNKDVFSHDGNYNIDDYGNLVELDLNLVCDMDYCVRRRPCFFRVSNTWNGRTTEYIILEQEVID